MAEGHAHNPLSHVVDHPTLEIPILGVEVPLPNIDGLQITRFMVMELIAAVLLVAALIPLARHVASQRVTKGRFWNIFEAILLFIRDGIARPAIDGGHENHGAGHEFDTAHAAADHAHGHGHAHAAAHNERLSDRFLPFLWTLFFFVLICNLLGMIPGGASATGSISVTATLALLTLGAVLIAGMQAMGPVGFWKNLVPKMDVPAALKPILWGLMLVIEVAGLLIKHVVLSVRLFANMMAGHIVIAVILGFVAMGAGWLTYLITPASLLGAIGISLLELFVAFLQAYIFTFLAALFIGSVTHVH
jgi:F-type H+-transporting ATPase subunit a